jgi:ribosomal-protein-serine acetyltransferase
LATIGRVLDPFAFDPPESFTTPRLVLRLAEPEDADDLFETILSSVNHLKPFIDWAQREWTLSMVEARIRRTRGYFFSRDSFEWLIWSADATQLLGAMDLHSFAWPMGRAELGFWLTPTAQGHGYVSEAGAAVVPWAASVFHRIESRCEVGNRRSRAALDRLGFEFEGILRHNTHAVDGSLVDECVYSKISAAPRGI